MVSFPDQQPQRDFANLPCFKRGRRDGKFRHGINFAGKRLIICPLFSIAAFTTPSKYIFFIYCTEVSFLTSSNVISSFKLLLFVLDLQDEPKGLSLGGCVVINKSLSLTVGTSRICLKNTTQLTKFNLCAFHALKHPVRCMYLFRLSDWSSPTSRCCYRCQDDRQDWVFCSSERDGSKIQQRESYARVKRASNTLFYKKKIFISICPSGKWK